MARPDPDCGYPHCYGTWLTIGGQRRWANVHCQECHQGVPHDSFQSAMSQEKETLQPSS
jgi:hypothetical protein